MTHGKTNEQALRAYLAELKRDDPLQDLPKPGRTAFAALRLIEQLLWIAYSIDPARLHVRPKRPQKEAESRSARMADLQEQLLDQCWSHSHAFTPDALRWSQEIQRHNAGVQLDCTRYVLQELAEWCHTHIDELLIAHGRGEEG